MVRMLREHGRRVIVCSMRSLSAALALPALAAAAAVCACHGPTAPDSTRVIRQVIASADWPASSPADAHLDRARLDDLMSRIDRGEYGRITSLLIAREGRLVVEEYFSGWSDAVPHTMQSVSKSVTALGVALAVQSGRLRLEDRIVDVFPQYRPLGSDDAWKESLTVRDLLSMRSGLNWDESLYAGSPLQRMNDCGCDWLRFVLDWPMREAPGTRWEYVSGGFILLGGAIGSATGSRLDIFLASQLFAPLSAQGAYWIQGLPDGLPHAGGGLYLRPRDMAKLGEVMRDSGRWQGARIVDASWPRALADRLTRGVRVWAGRSFDYGLGWWI